MNDLSLDEIADKIITAILTEPHINKETLQLRIKPLLKIWLKKTDSFKSNKVDKNRLQFTIEKRGLSIKFWVEQIQKIKNKDEMQLLYNGHKLLMQKEGFE